jgi:hypothetical protein
VANANRLHALSAQFKQAAYGEENATVSHFFEFNLENIRS